MPRNAIPHAQSRYLRDAQRTGVLPGGAPPRRPMPPPAGRFLGLIRTAGPNNEPDHADARYWVQRAYAANTSADPHALLAVSRYNTTDDPRFLIITATNLLELVSGSHGLPPDTPVEVSVALDRGPTPTRRYYFSAGGGGDPKIRIESVSGATWPRTYTAKRWYAGATSGAAMPAHNYAELRYAADIVQSYAPLPVGAIVDAWWEPHTNRFGMQIFGDFNAFTTCP